MDSDWRDDLNTLLERNRYILKNGLRADCSFLAGVVPKEQRLFHAQKYLLANASAVFETMFFGSLPEKGDKPIEITDIEADDFENLLLFIYTDEIKMIGEDQAQRLYYAAEKYMVNPLKKTCMEFLLKNVRSQNVCELFEFSQRFEEKILEEKCKKFILKNVRSANVCELFEFSKRFEEKNLEEKCTEIIRNQTYFVIHSSSFLKADISTVDFILNQNCLSFNSELDLFMALENYANHKFPIDKRVDCNWICETCQQQKSDFSASETDKNEKTQDPLCQKIEPIEKMLKLFRKIRFLTLTVDEFAKGPAVSKWISESDALKILVCIVDRTNIKDHFPIGFSLSEEKREVALEFSFAVLPTKNNVTLINYNSKV